jgi:hypothetical protein
MYYLSLYYEISLYKIARPGHQAKKTSSAESLTSARDKKVTPAIRNELLFTHLWCLPLYENNMLPYSPKIFLKRISGILIADQW